MYNTFTLPLPHVLLSSVPSVTHGGKGEGEVGDVVFRRIHDPVLLVQTDHRRLDVGVAQHGLDLSNGGTMVQDERGGRVSKGMR